MYNWTAASDFHMPNAMMAWRGTPMALAAEAPPLRSEWPVNFSESETTLPPCLSNFRSKNQKNMSEAIVPTWLATAAEAL